MVSGWHDRGLVGNEWAPLTDEMMRALAEKVLALRPAVKIIYMSGYSTERDEGPIPEGRMTVLQKPFLPTLLLRSIRQLLDG